MKINILLAEDHAMVRQAIRSVISTSAIIGDIWEAKNGHEAVLKFYKHKPHLVIIDYEMPNFDGLYAIKKIAAQSSKTPILLLSAFLTRDRLQEAIRAGIRGCLTKDTNSVEIEAAIKKLVAGGYWFKGQIAEFASEILISSINPNIKQVQDSNKVSLTSRERDILKLFAEGLNSNEIAGKLSINIRTVELNKSNLYKKINARSPIELARYALREKIAKL